MGCTAPQPPEAWPLSLAGAPAQGGSHVLSVFVPLSVIVSLFDCVFAFMISCGLSLFNPHVAIDLKKTRRISPEGFLMAWISMDSSFQEGGNCEALTAGRT